jgi:16S rRNA (cytosine1402-N4)-methyltransferase
MLHAVIGMLKVEHGGIYIDATIGLGGHAEAILKLIGPEGKLIGIDRDEDALQEAEKRLSGKQVVLKRGSFSDMKSLLHAEGFTAVDGILFDLGVSMLQLKDISRGFSFLSEQRLDMRMDRKQKTSAWDVVNRYPENILERIIREFGEDRLSRKIARAIVLTRQKKRVETCRELSGIVEAVYGGRGKTHPATKTFQALRIEVNRELEQLKGGLEAAVQLLKQGGRLCVLSYHSLEDRIVKHFLSYSAKQGLLKTLTRKPLQPDPEEKRRNPSSRSAKLRAAERL